MPPIPPTPISLSLACAAALVLAPPPAAAQALARADSQAHRLLATRDALTALAQRLDSLGGSPAAAPADRARARELAQDIAARLEVGDFQSGDRIVVRVVGEVGLPETLAVDIGREVDLPTVGTIPLKGVLRSEIEPEMRRAIARAIRDPEVHARALVRVSVQGEVARPGYCNVPPDATLADVLTVAGGPTKDAKVQDMRVERDGAKLLEKDRLRRLVEQGRTLDDVGLRPGDEFIVPGRGKGDAYEGFKLAAVILGIPVTIYTLTKIF